MSEIFITPQEEHNAEVIDTLRNDYALLTPEEKQEKFVSGIDDLASEETYRENREFYSRMAGLTALRSTVELQGSDELQAISHQIHGPLGYNSNPTIRKM